MNLSEAKRQNLITEHFDEKEAVLIPERWRLVLWETAPNEIVVTDEDFSVGETLNLVNLLERVRATDVNNF